MLEFDSVEISDDMNIAIAPIILSILTYDDYELKPEERAELNLYYVACSRAKKELFNAKYV